MDVEVKTVQEDVQEEEAGMVDFGEGDRDTIFPDKN